MKPFLRLLLAWPLSCGPLLPAADPEPQPPQPIHLTLVDDQAIGFATFQSHNQKAVKNQHGIFMTYVQQSNDDYSAQKWRLMRSTDDGRSFTEVMAETRATSAPAIETARDGSIFFARPDFKDGNAYLSRLDAPQDNPTTTTLTGGAAGKYCMLLDQPRGQLYYFAHNGTFHIATLDNQGVETTQPLTHGEIAYLQYPHLTLARDGTLFAAWTTSHRDRYLYRSIHAMKSIDGGQTWQTLAGEPLALPIPADDTGPATRISRDDELDVHSWLSACMAKDGKLHLVYWAKTTPQRQRYVRYDAATGELEADRLDLFPERSMDQPNDSGVLVADRSVPHSTLYFVSTIDDRKRLACVASDDNGLTWREHAVSDRLFDHRVYSIGGARDVTGDGWIIGSFTDTPENAETYYEPDSGDVYFFRFRSADRPAR